MKTQKHLKLYIALFCLSMLISASVAVVHADSTQTTTLTYTIPSISYEVNIPATLSLNDTSTLNFSLTPESQLNDCYAVLLQVDHNNPLPSFLCILINHSLASDNFTLSIRLLPKLSFFITLITKL